MSVLAKCVKMAISAGNKEMAVYLTIKASQENGDRYLDNAYSELSRTMTRHQFDGYLSSLAARGAYKRIDGNFGEVGRY